MIDFFALAIEEMDHYPDGRMRESAKLRMLKRGMSEETIAALEADVKEKIRMREIFRRSRAMSTAGMTAKEKVKYALMERQGLTLEESLNQGYISLDDLSDRAEAEEPLPGKRHSTTTDSDKPEVEF